MADPQIFPGFQSSGNIPEVLRAGLVVYSASALNALQQTPEDQIRFADIAGVTVAPFNAKIPIDISALADFEEDKGRDLDYHQMDLVAIEVGTVPFYLAKEWHADLIRANIPMANINTTGSDVIAKGRRHKARMVAAVLKEGRPGGKALTYPQVGAPNGLTLFNTAHYANPNDASYGTFSNFHAAAGKFTNGSIDTARLDMRMVPSVTAEGETLGSNMSKVIGPSHMEPHFRAVATQNQVMQIATVGGDGVAASVSNINMGGNAGWTYEIAPLLDSDPYLVAFKAAFLIANGRAALATELPHLWFTVSDSYPGAHGVEMIAPSTTFAPRISVLGLGSEHEIKRNHVAIIARMSCGAAAGLPHVIHRYEET